MTCDQFYSKFCWNATIWTKYMCRPKNEGPHFIDLRVWELKWGLLKRGKSHFYSKFCHCSLNFKQFKDNPQFLLNYSNLCSHWGAIPPLSSNSNPNPCIAQNLSSWTQIRKNKISRLRLKKVTRLDIRDFESWELKKPTGGAVGVVVGEVGEGLQDWTKIPLYVKIN